MPDHLIWAGDLLDPSITMRNARPKRDVSSDGALTQLLVVLRRLEYRFVTPTPATHAIVFERRLQREARSLTDILGWSLPFRQNSIDPGIFALLVAAEAVLPGENGLWHPTIRVSSLHGNLYLHSAFPTEAYDAVFFGPDSYRFADAIDAELDRQPVATGAKIVDIGTGSGVGAIVAGAAAPGSVITMTDINPRALDFARINAAAAGIEACGIVAHDLSGVTGRLDLILANPPYIADPAGRAYRDGGSEHGSGVALAMTAMALPRLAPGGRFLLYSGSAIVSGEDWLGGRLDQLAADAGCAMRYHELDPDVFGEELASPAYHDVDRIAVVLAVFTAPAV